jgi:hypothetical protein
MPMSIRQLAASVALLGVISSISALETQWQFTAKAKVGGEAVSWKQAAKARGELPVDIDAPPPAALWMAIDERGVPSYLHQPIPLRGKRARGAR